MAAQAVLPLVVSVLAGNSVTATLIAGYLTTADTGALRRLHPAVAGAVAAVPWADTDTPVVDVVRWRAALPGAVGLRLAPRVVWSQLTSSSAAAALAGVTRLDLHGCGDVTDELLGRLPPSIHTLVVRSCHGLTGRASFAHLPALVSLDCGWTKVVNEGTGGLPPCLQELAVSGSRGLVPGASLAHLTHLRVLRANGSAMDDAALAALPPSVVELQAAQCRRLTAAASFAHLPALHTLDVTGCAISDASLATMPPCLAFLNASSCTSLTSAAELRRLPGLTGLDVSDTQVGNVLVASLPPSLFELRLAGCPRVTTGASLGHLRALRVLHSIGTALSPTTLAACRARGCDVPAAGQLVGHGTCLTSFAVLADGRLASGDSNGEVRVWDTVRGGAAVAVLAAANGPVRALAALPDGRRLAVGVGTRIGLWDVDDAAALAAPAPRATLDCESGVLALVALRDGRLAAGCGDRRVRIVDVDAGAVVVVLKGHIDKVTALASLPDGRLASGSADAAVRLWNLGTEVCAATLTGHSSPVCCLAVLPDDRLASGAGDSTARLWDVRSRTCVGVLSGHAGGVTTLVALPDGRLATGSEDNTIRVWDTRAERATAAGIIQGVVLGRVPDEPSALALLSGDRLASASGGTGGAVHLLAVPLPRA